MTKIKKIPKKETAGDYINFFIKQLLIGASAVGGGPIAGIAASQFSGVIDFILKPSLEKRREEWFDWLAAKIVELEEVSKGITEDLKNREDFITFTIQATQVALKTHQKDKLDMLKASIVHRALKPDFNEDEALTFLLILDDFTPSHIFILKKLGIHGKPFIIDIDDGKIVSKNPGLAYYSEEREDKFSQVANQMNLDNLGYNKNFIKRILNDLVTKGLIEEKPYELTYDWKVTMPGSGKKELCLALSDFGKEFVNFIS